jgi:hypothetical protein
LSSAPSSDAVSGFPPFSQMWRFCIIF